ncbi:MAG: sctD [Chlamydiales bacterium]|nr:sctD [Chlamydiales bacterium]
MENQESSNSVTAESTSQFNFYKNDKVALISARFIVEEGDLRAQTYSMEGPGDWIIGRDPDQCQIILEDSAISRKHAICKRDDATRFTLTNLMENNPIYVNGEPLTNEHLLEDGDTIQIGGQKLVFYKEEILVNPLDTDNNSNQLKEDNAMNSMNYDQELASDLEQDKQDTIFEVGPDALDYLELQLLDPGRWVLKILHGPLQGAEFPLEENKAYILGNDPKSCDIILHDRTVSKKHAQITFSSDGTILLEDLSSKNGILIDGQKLEEARNITNNTLFVLGTTSVLLIDREAPAETLLASVFPIATAITQSVQEEELQEENAKNPEESSQKVTDETPIINAESQAADPSKQESPITTQDSSSSTVEQAITPPQETITPPSGETPATTHPIVKEERKILRKLILGATAFSLCLGVGYAVYQLFQTQEVEHPSVLVQTKVDAIMKDFPSVSYQLQKETLKIRLWDHLLTSMDLNQLLYNLQSIAEIKEIDNAIIIDEGVWKEMNQILSNNPTWKGVSIYARIPKHFVLMGHLKTKQQAEELMNYLKLNFDYMDLLDNQMVVEEELMDKISNLLRENQLREVLAEFFDEEIFITGAITAKDRPIFEQILQQIKKTPGLKGIKNNVVEVTGQDMTEALVDLSSQYPVSGYFQTNQNKISVVVNGRIYSEGDKLDDYSILTIKDNFITLEKGDVKYKIKYSN